MLKDFMTEHDNLLYSWHDVPVDWDKIECPSNISENTRLDLRYRGGVELFGVRRPWGRSWVQENKDYDIVQYRVVM